MYQIPERPNAGGVQWKPLLIPIVLLVVGFPVITQVTAAALNYAPQLGSPAFAIGKAGIYAPWAWIDWTLKYINTPASSGILKGLAAGGVCALLAIGWYVVAVIRGQKRIGSADGLHGSARFAAEAEIKEAGLLGQQDGVYIGGWTNKGTVQYLRHNGAEHVLGFAPTRSGKGVGLVIPTMLAWSESVIAYDIKGELWALSAGYRHQTGQQCFRFSPSETDSARYNPLSAIRIGSDREVADVQIVAELLIDRGDTDQSGDSYWREAAKAIMTGALMHVCYVAHKRREPSIRHVVELLADPRQTIEATLTDMLDYQHDTSSPWVDDDGNPTATHPLVASNARIMLNKADRDRSGVLSNVMAALSLYDDPIVVKNTSSSDFRIRDLVDADKPTSVYLVVPPSDQDRLRPLIRVFFAQVIAQLTEKMEFKAGQRVANKHRLLLMIDEFPTLGKMPVLERGLAVMAGYGIKAFLIAQDLSQITGAYGEHESIVSNCHVRTAFAPNTLDTAQLLSDMTGVTTVKKESSTYSGGRFSSVASQRSATVDYVERPLMTTDEILRLPASRQGMPGAQLIFSAGYPVIYGTQILYYIDPEFTRRSRIDPPAVR